MANGFESGNELPNAEDAKDSRRSQEGDKKNFEFLFRALCETFASSASGCPCFSSTAARLLLPAIGPEAVNVVMDALKKARGG